MALTDQKQHRIPQVYLRQWAFKDSGNADTLSVMKMGDPVTHYKHVKNFTAETNLFDTTLHDEGFERFFDDKCKYVESNFPKIIAALQANTHDGQSRIYLTEFMSNLFVRQRRTFDFLKSVITKLYLRKKLLNEIAILEEEEDPNLIKAVYEEMAIDPDHDLNSKVSAVILPAWKHFNKVFSRFNHVILKSPENRSWPTTDNPIITTNFGKDGWLVGPEAEVFFAISKEFMVYMYHDEKSPDKPLRKLENNAITLASHEIQDDIVFNTIVKSRPDYFINGEDLENFNAQTNEFQTNYRPAIVPDSRLKTAQMSLMDTPFPPTLTDPDLEKLLEKMNAEYDPIEVLVDTNPTALENECFTIVDQMVSQNGGKKILGWQVWKGAYIIEAEFHAIWETKEGVLMDVSFKKNGAPIIVFIEDDKIIHSGKQINNVRLDLIGSPLVDDFIVICDQLFRLLNKGKRANLFGNNLWNELSGAQRNNLDEVVHMKKLVFGLLDAGGNQQSLCPCNSGRKYKNCHSTKVKSLKYLD